MVHAEPPKQIDYKKEILKDEDHRRIMEVIAKDLEIVLIPHWQ